MTRKEAFLTALRLETPDVVPVAPLIHSRYANEVLGRTDWRAVYEVHQMLGTTAHRGPIGIGGVYGVLGNYCGMEQLLYDLYDIPELIHDVVEV